MDTQGWLYSKDLMENNLAQYSQDGKRISLQDFARFLRDEQGVKEKLETVAGIMRDFLQAGSVEEKLLISAKKKILVLVKGLVEFFYVPPTVL